MENSLNRPPQGAATILFWLVAFGLVSALPSVAFSQRNPARAACEASVYRHPKLGDLPYRMFAPATLTPDERYPLVLYLHPAGAKGTDNERQLAPLGAWAAAAGAVESPCYLVAPQASMDLRVTSSDWKARDYRTSAQPSDGEVILTELISELMRRYPIDPDRITVAGAGLGGTAAIELLLSRPGFYAGGLVIGANADASRISELSHLPLRWYVSRRDESALVKASEAAEKALSGEGSRFERIVVAEPVAAAISQGLTAENLNWLKGLNRRDNDWKVDLVKVTPALIGQLLVTEGEIRAIPQKEEDAEIEESLRKGDLSLREFERRPQAKGYLINITAGGKRFDVWIPSAAMPIERFRPLKVKDRVRVKGYLQNTEKGLRLWVEKGDWWSVTKAAPEPPKKKDR
jgi:pimeloyl-ACP methyl ester carboxylesterase